jgi:hypothetical protein
MFVLVLDSKGEFENEFQYGRHNVEYACIKTEDKIFTIYNPVTERRMGKTHIKKLVEQAKGNNAKIPRPNLINRVDRFLRAGVSALIYRTHSR